MSRANPGWVLRVFTANCSSWASISVKPQWLSIWFIHADHLHKLGRPFLSNHAHQLVSTDFFVVPTATFRLLFVFLVLSHDRRRVLHFGVTAHPTSEWTAQQLRHAILDEQGLRRILKLYFEYYEKSCTHLGLGKDAPIHRPVQSPALGKVIELPQIGGLHHRYERRAA